MKDAIGYDNEFIMSLERPSYATLEKLPGLNQGCHGQGKISGK